MSDTETTKLAAALAAEVNARQSSDYEPRAAKGGLTELVMTSKSGAARPAGLIVRRTAPEAAAAAVMESVAQKTAAKLKGKTGALSLLVPRAPSAKDVDAWAEAAAQVVAALEKGAKPDADLLTLDDPPAECPFLYASWSPRSRPDGLLVDAFYRGPAGKPLGADDHWMVLLDVPAAAGKAVGRAFALEVPEGAAVRRAWWAAPKGSGFAFRRF